MTEKRFIQVWLDLKNRNGCWNCKNNWSICKVNNIGTVGYIKGVSHCRLETWEYEKKEFKRMINNKQFAPDGSIMQYDYSSLNSRYEANVGRNEIIEWNKDACNVKYGSLERIAERLNFKQMQLENCKEDYSRLYDLYDQVKDDLVELKEENCILQKENKELKEENCIFQKENKELKEELIIGKEYCKSLETDLRNCAEARIELQERNNRQAEQLNKIYTLIEKEDWKALKNIIDDFKESEKLIKKEWECY